MEVIIEVVILCLAFAQPPAQPHQSFLSTGQQLRVPRPPELGCRGPGECALVPTSLLLMPLGPNSPATKTKPYAHEPRCLESLSNVEYVNELGRRAGSFVVFKDTTAEYESWRDKTR